MKVWARLITEEQIVKSATTECEPFNYVHEFHACLSKLCLELDVPTPVLLTKHIQHFVQFTNCNFLPGDFVENVEFDKLVLENITGKG
ncbi:MAG: hypothetical protein FWE53_01145 [Firmicutes bacterium]|nr:hypothetical protein [Bacillota bacterium]